MKSLPEKTITEREDFNSSFMVEQNRLTYLPKQKTTIMRPSKRAAP